MFTVQDVIDHLPGTTMLRIEREDNTVFDSRKDAWAVPQELLEEYVSWITSDGVNSLVLKLQEEM